MSACMVIGEVVYRSELKLKLASVYKSLMLKLYAIWADHLPIFQVTLVLDLEDPLTFSQVAANMVRCTGVV